MTTNKDFWNEEYKNPEHLALSTEPSSDMISFARWAEKNAEWPPFPEGGMVVDIGCGNGRNIIALAGESKMKGLGIDISEEAILQATTAAKDLPIQFIVQGAEDPIPLPDASVDVVLDMMTSHFLNEEEREKYVKEIVRIIKPYGWMFFKSFILDGDQNALRLIKDNPAGEKNTYIHPRIGSQEFVWTEDLIRSVFSPYFKIYKLIRSHKHIKDGKPHKRRTVSVYMERMRE